MLSRGATVGHSHKNAKETMPRHDATNFLCTDEVKIKFNTRDEAPSMSFWPDPDARKLK